MDYYYSLLLNKISVILDLRV